MNPAFETTIYAEQDCGDEVKSAGLMWNYTHFVLVFLPLFFVCVTNYELTNKQTNSKDEYENDVILSSGDPCNQGIAKCGGFFFVCLFVLSLL